MTFVWLWGKNYLSSWVLAGNSGRWDAPASWLGLCNSHRMRFVVSPESISPAPQHLSGKTGIDRSLRASGAGGLRAPWSGGICLGPAAASPGCPLLFPALWPHLGPFSEKTECPELSKHHTTKVAFTESASLKEKNYQRALADEWKEKVVPSQDRTRTLILVLCEKQPSTRCDGPSEDASPTPQPNPEKPGELEFPSNSTQAWRSQRKCQSGSQRITEKSIRRSWNLVSAFHCVELRKNSLLLKSVFLSLQNSACYTMKKRGGLQSNTVLNTKTSSSQSPWVPSYREP